MKSGIESFLNLWNIGTIISSGESGNEQHGLERCRHYQNCHWWCRWRRGMKRPWGISGDYEDHGANWLLSLKSWEKELRGTDMFVENNRTSKATWKNFPSTLVARHHCLWHKLRIWLSDVKLQNQLNAWFCWPYFSSKEVVRGRVVP